MTDGNRVYFPKLYFYFDVEKLTVSNWVTNPPKEAFSIVIAIVIKYFIELINNKL